MKEEINQDNESLSEDDLYYLLKENIIILRDYTDVNKSLAAASNLLYESLDEYGLGIIDLPNRNKEILDEFSINFKNMVKEVINQGLENFKEKILKSTNEATSKQKTSSRIIYISLIAILISLVTMLFSGQMSYKFYNNSVKAKSEIRQEIINEIESADKAIYDKGYVKALEENTRMMKLFIKENPKTGNDLRSFEKGYKAKREKGGVN